MKINFIFYFVLFILAISFVSADDTNCVYFFYGEGCPHCAKTEPEINKLEVQSQFPVIVHRFEIYNNRSNVILLNKYFEAYNIPEKERGVPIVFLKDDYYSGDERILNTLYDDLSKRKGLKCPNIDSVFSNNTSKSEKINTLSIITVIGAAIVDSINPCAIAVLLILMSALLVSGNKKRALGAGIAFTFSIYIAYFLFGLGIFSALQISGLSYWFYKFIGIIAILIGIFNIKDFFWYGGAGFVMEIPRSWRPTLKKMLGSVTSPLGAFFMGFLVCLLELPCTGGPYIFILGLLAEKTTMISSIPILLLYNLFFVLPLIIITFAIYFGFSNVEKATEWKDKNIKILHLIAGIIMLLLGIGVVSGII